MDVVSAVVRNPNLRDICMCLRDLNLTSKTWPNLSRVFERGSKDGYRRVGTIRELHLDRNRLGCLGVEMVAQTLGTYAPLRVLSLDQVSSSMLLRRIQRPA